MATTLPFSPDTLAAIGTLCVRHKVKALYLFGSALTDRFTPESDIDLLVEFDQRYFDGYIDNFFDMEVALNHLLDRRVDITPESQIRNPVLRHTIEQTRVKIYG